MTSRRLLSVAPMMERTDRHCRYLLRLFSPNSWLYTEMITATALVDGGRVHLLAFHPDEHPVALQLGGSEPQRLARAARLGEQAGYDEINLNVGCPSDRVQSGRFGAALMGEPGQVATCVRAMRRSVDVPVTVKTRLGIDDLDSYAFLRRFVDAVSEAGCRTVVVHARKALLSGLTPKHESADSAAGLRARASAEVGLSVSRVDPQRGTRYRGQGSSNSCSTSTA